MLDYPNIFNRHNIEPRGVIHVGGYLGDEDQSYRSMNFKHRLFIEAQPETFVNLCNNLRGSGAFVENYAISDHNGHSVLHVANNQQSSSLLIMDKHSLIYPDIKQENEVEVAAIKLDDLLDKYYSGFDFNFLNIDIQGAELMALSGAIRTLRNIDVLNLEINFDDLYIGAPHVRQLDAFLSAFDFIRTDTVLADATWGDAIYVRNKYTKADRIQRIQLEN